VILLLLVNDKSDLKGLAECIAHFELFSAGSFQDESDSTMDLTLELVLTYLENKVCDGEVLLFLEDDHPAPHYIDAFITNAERFEVAIELIKGLVMCVKSEETGKFSQLRKVLDNRDYFSTTSRERLEGRTGDSLGSIHMVLHPQFDRNNSSLRQLYQGMALNYGATATLIG